MSSAKKAADTRRAYAFITTVEVSAYAGTRRTRAEIRGMLDRVWTNKKPRPSLHFLRDAETSYYSTVDHAIAIASHQQDYATFLHEIVHAEGLWDHDSRFMRRYISLLALHARCDECKLRLAAGLFGIKM